MKHERKALLLSAGYGRGHHAAALALQEELERRGWQVTMLDACAQARPRSFRLSQRFYRFCVHHAPWLWGILYRLMDSADMPRLLRAPGISAAMRLLRRRLRGEQTDLVVCTYPLYAYMLDVFAQEGWFHTPYAVVVTDALAINRAWVQTSAPLICLPDSRSLALVQERHALPAERLAAPGFPVRAAFSPGVRRPIPGEQGQELHLVYGIYAPLRRVQADVQALLRALPHMRISLLAENPSAGLQALAARYPDRVRLCAQGQDVAELLRSAHFYLGKAGAATMFEACAAEVPVLVNHALPGQEEGNLQLLAQDGAALSVPHTDDLIRTLCPLLANSAAGWQRMCRAIRAAGRSGGAARTVDTIEGRLFP